MCGMSSSWRSVSDGVSFSWRTYYYLLTSSTWRTAQWHRARRAASAASATAVCAAIVYAVLVLGTLWLAARAFLESAAGSFSCPTATATAAYGPGGGVGFASAEAGPAPTVHYSLGRQTFG